MPATRPGVHRQHKQALQSAKGRLDKALKMHVKSCPVCSRAGSDPYDHCQAWWQMAIELHRVRRTLRRYSQPETDNMDALFEVDTP
jgi:hypothetical protein